MAALGGRDRDEMLLDRPHLGIDDRAAVEGAERQREPSGSIRNPMPIVGRLETMVKPIPACAAAAPRRCAASVTRLVFCEQRAVDVGHDEFDAGHAGVLASS